MTTIKSEAVRLQKTTDVLGLCIANNSKTGATIKINGWITILKNHKGLQGIANDLEKLKAAMVAKDGEKIYTLLQKLGDSTVAAGESTDSIEGAAVKKLGVVLQKTSKFVKKIVR